MKKSKIQLVLDLQNLLLLISLSTIFLILGVCSAQAQDTLTIHQNGNIRTHTGAKIGIYGSLANHGTFGNIATSNEGVLSFHGNAQQWIGGDSLIQFDSIWLDMLEINLQQELRVEHYLDFDSGTIRTNRSDSNLYFVHFLPGSDHGSSSNASFVDGTIRKTGNTAFLFPTGQYNSRRHLTISAPGNITDAFTAFYRDADPTNHGYNTQAFDSTCGGSPVLVDITEEEYWFLEATSGSSAVEVRLSYDSASQVNTPSELLVVRWDGSEWVSEGNGGVTGTNVNGTVASGTGCGSQGTPTSLSSFGALTIGGSTLTAVPIELVSFDVQKTEPKYALLEWVTASEINNSHFEIQRSKDGINYNVIGEVSGAGTSYDLTNYDYIDFTPLQGINYYRLKQVDFDGNYSYSEVRLLRFDETKASIQAYPIPTSNFITIDLGSIPDFHADHEIQLTNLQGQVIYRTTIERETLETSLNLTSISSGIYLLTVNNLHQIKIIKN